MLPIYVFFNKASLTFEFVIRIHLTPAVLEVLDENQFGVISDSSTSHALIKMLHRWTEATDGNGSTVRVILFDYKKAFDNIDHTILVQYNELKWQMIVSPNGAMCRPEYHRAPISAHGYLP
jgi:ABC-type Mn2+/Zn2+ transport system ATPase subunit